MPTHKHLPNQPPDVCAQIRLEDGRRINLLHDTRGGSCIYCGRVMRAVA